MKLETNKLLLTETMTMKSKVLMMKRQLNWETTMTFASMMMTDDSNSNSNQQTDLLMMNLVMMMTMINDHSNVDDNFVRDLVYDRD